MKVRIAISPDSASWIIGKIAERMVAELSRRGIDATVTHEADDTADINHWMSYATVSRRAGRASTVFITHIDDPYKTAHLRSILQDHVDLGLCMSTDMMKALTAWGVPADRLWYVAPALDSPGEPTRIRIAIATRLYPDGRKRESFLVRLASERELSSFHFEISGTGWESVVPTLRDAGASVMWHPGSEDYQADYQTLIDSMRTCEYYLYLGMDEGSLGTLDALALGLKTIVTPQGFHLDLEGGVTEPFVEYPEFLQVMDRLARERRSRFDSVRDWTWARYVDDHLLVWEALLSGKRKELPELIGKQGRYATIGRREVAHEGLQRRTWAGYYRRSLSPARIFDALLRIRWLQPLRRFARSLWTR